MLTRRDFLRGGLSAFALGWLGKKGLNLSRFKTSSTCAPSGALGIDATTPLLQIPPNPPSVIVDGIPFAEWFFGDDFDNDHIPFHFIPDYGQLPDPAEDVDVAIVGGGLSGLTSAYLLRNHNAVLLELRDRFGGNSQGETWQGVNYSLGGAYFITPDHGSFLDNFYHELGLQHLVRINNPPDPMELNSVILDDFWTGDGFPEDERQAFMRYADVVTDIWDNHYPDIPLSSDPVEAQRVRDLDRLTFRQDVEQRMGIPMTPLLRAGVQSYFFSSFNSPMEEISAAGGWNFVAAEEGGRWVLPGGNARMVYELWQRLTKLENRVRPECRPHYLRGRCRVIDVRSNAEEVARRLEKLR